MWIKKQAQNQGVPEYMAEYKEYFQFLYFIIHYHHPYGYFYIGDRDKEELLYGI
jgi:hypothetical protein